MFGISSWELVIILVFGFLLFGPDKLPQMGRTLGRALRQFRETQEKLTAVVQTEVVDPMAAVVNAPDKKPAPVAAADEDADAEDADAPAAPVHKETFAERRARLAAEKAEREAAQAVEADDDAAPAEDAPVSEDAAEAPAEQSETAPEQPAEPTIEDLYARRPRKRAAAAAQADVTEGGEQ